MSTQFYNISESAVKIGISRRALYYYYLDRYPPTYFGGQPVLTSEQIKAIRAERKARNGHRKTA